VASACYNDFAMPKISPNFFKFKLFQPAIAAGVLLCGALLLSGCGLTPTELKKIRPPSLPQPKVPVLKAGELPTITVIPGGSESYWNQAKLGAEAAGKKFGARIEWKVPVGQIPNRNEVAVYVAQKEAVEETVETSQGLVVAPVDSTKMMQPVGKAARAGVSVVAFDRDVFTIQNKLSFVHNDDEASGVLAAQQVGRLLGTRYKVGLFPALEKRRNEAAQRISAFETAMHSKFPDAELTKWEQLPQVIDEDVVFTSEEYRSLLSRDFQSVWPKLSVVAFGADEDLLKAIQKGKLSALISPDYYQMAFQSVKAIMDFRATKQMPPREIKIAPRVLTENTAKPTNRSTP